MGFFFFFNWLFLPICKIGKICVKIQGFSPNQNKSYLTFSHLQLGTLGAGNHYAEIQVVDEIFNEYAAKKMGIDHKGQVCVMIHSGSRGLGHQVATGIFWT